MEDIQKPFSATEPSTEDKSFERPCLQLQTQEHKFKELNWPPQGVVEQPSLSPHPSNSLSQPPAAVNTDDRPIVTPPVTFSRDSLSKTTSSLEVSAINSKSDDTCVPVITAIKDSPGSVAVSSGKTICPSIEFSNVQQIIDEPQQVKQQEKEEQPTADEDLREREPDTEPTAKQSDLASLVPDDDNSKGINTVLDSTPVADSIAAELPGLVPLSQEEDPDDSAKLHVPLLVSSSGCPSSRLDQLQFPLQKSLAGVSPLIMSCYEEHKEQLVLDDSDSELEMPECSNKSLPHSLPCGETENLSQPSRSGGAEVSQPSVSEAGVKPLSLEKTSNLCESLVKGEHCSDLCASECAPRGNIMSGGEVESGSVSEPPLKRAKVRDASTDDLYGSVCEGSMYPLPASKSSQDIHIDTSVDIEASCEITGSDNNSGQSVPDLPVPLNKPPKEVTQPAENFSSALKIQDHSDRLNLECPHEPVDVASDGADTVDQTLPMESAREHALVPNVVRCAHEDDQSDNDRDDPGDKSDDADGGSCARVKPWSSTLHRSHQYPRTSVTDECVYGQTAVRANIVDDVIDNDAIPPPRVIHAPVSSSDTSIHTLFTSAVVPATMEPAQLFTEHQIVPEESFSNTTLSSQSLYSDFHEKNEKCYTVLQDETDLEQMDNSMVSDFVLKSVETRKTGQTCLSGSDDQTLPDSPLQESDHCSPDHELTKVDGVYSRQGCGRGLFGFQYAKHPPSSQDSGHSVATTRLNLSRPHLRLGLSKRQHCLPLHKSKQGENPVN